MKNVDGGCERRRTNEEEDRKKNKEPWESFLIREEKKREDTKWKLNEWMAINCPLFLVEMVLFKLKSLISTNIVCYADRTPATRQKKLKQKRNINSGLNTWWADSANYLGSSGSEGSNSRSSSSSMYINFYCHSLSCSYPAPRRLLLSYFALAMPTTFTYVSSDAPLLFLRHETHIPYDLNGSRGCNLLHWYTRVNG